MDGVTDLPFRRLIREVSGGDAPLFVSEFLSAGSSLFLTLANLRATRFDKEEEPFCMQVFGHNAERLAGAALKAQELGASSVELNAGCPARRVAGKGSGSGLLKDLPNLRKVLQAMKAAVKIPLFLKSRIGWDENSICIDEVLEIAEGEGVEQLTIHGRTKEQCYKGLANWDAIGDIAAKAKIPIIGNGDINNAQIALNRMKNYGVKGIAIGRGALQNPWIFSQIADAVSGKEPAKITPSQVCSMVIRYEKLLRADSLREGQILGKLKQLSSRMFKGDFRHAILRTQNIQDFLSHCFNLSANAFSFPYSVGS